MRTELALDKNKRLPRVQGSDPAGRVASLRAIYFIQTTGDDALILNAHRQIY